MSDQALGAEQRREDFKFFHILTPRWNDLDAYRHINNARFYGFFDTAIMAYIQTAGGFDLVDGPVVPFTVENMCRFHNGLRFGIDVECGLRVAKLGSSSVRYEIGLFATGSPAVAAAGYFVDVFVDRINERPVPIPSPIRDHLQHILVE